MIPLLKYQLKLCRILWDHRHEIINAAFCQMRKVLEREMSEQEWQEYLEAMRYVLAVAVGIAPILADWESQEGE